MLEDVRIDKWLWAARWYKTRSLAAKAVSGGKVHLNGARVKSAKKIQVGDKLIISKEPYEFRLTVLGLAEKRRPAREARLLYEEAEESIQERENTRSLLRMTRAGYTAPDSRPSKRDRRKIKEFIRKQ